MGDVVDPHGMRLPDQFGKYSILGHLATGGMAEVYLARSGGSGDVEGFQKIVVIKRIRPDLTGDDETTGFFLDEARLVATLEHPNIAQVYDVGLVAGSYFFVMEYVHGADLRQLMDTAHRKGREVTLADALYIIIGVCAALHYAHEKHDLDGNPLEIIHRDVSPSNVLISHDGAVKVCDFGIAKATRRSAHTSRGVLKGKYAYMSPEQCRSQPLDRRSDIFAIGILLHELTTLSPLFRADSDYELLRQIVEDPVPPPSAKVADYPVELEAIVMRALARDPAERYPTAQAMQLELEAFARAHMLPLSSVNVARLMNSLFEKRIDAWLRAQRDGQEVEHLIDTSVRHTGDFPVFVPIGSNEGDPEIVVEGTGRTQPPRSSASMPAVRRSGVLDAVSDTPLPRRLSRSMPAMSVHDVRRSSQLPVVAPTEPTRASPRRSGVMWLVLALVFGLVAGGVTLAESTLDRAAGSSVERDLQGDAERVASALDATARTARLRADSIATTPVLRAAIETDAATLSDLASSSELLFTPGRDEVLEIWQLRDGAPSSLLRMPAAATALVPPKGREIRIESTGEGVVVVASAPISGYKTAIGGVLAIRLPVDLAIARKYVATHAHHATLVGLDRPLELVAGPDDGGAIHVAVPASAEWSARKLELVAAPAVAAAGFAWIAPTRWAAVGLAALSLLAFLVVVARRRRTS